MAKNTNAEALKLLQQAVKLLSKVAATSVQMPAVDDIDDLDKAKIAEVAEAFGISVDGKKASEVKALLTTAAKIVEGATEDLDKDEVIELCEAVGQQPAKKLAATVEALKEYFDAAQDSEDGDTETADDDDEEKPAKGKKAKDADDDDDDGDDDEEVKPKGKKAKGGDDDDEEKPAKGKKAKDDDDGDDDDDDDEKSAVSDKDKAKRLKAYNKVAEKELEDYDELEELLTDEEGDIAEWGVPYVKGEDAYCCGIELETVKKDGKKVGKCAVTGKLFRQNKEGELEEIEAEADDDGDDD